jgi:hypothetical protein
VMAPGIGRISRLSPSSSLTTVKAPAAPKDRPHRLAAADDVRPRHLN